MPEETKELENFDDLDDLMAETFGTTADDEYYEDAEDAEEVDLDAEGEEEEPEEDEDQRGKLDHAEDAAEEDDDAEESDDEDEDTDDDTAEDEESDEGDDDAESEESGDSDEGDGGDETLSDGQLALDMAVDARLDALVIEEDTFDPSIIGDEKDFIADAADAFGDDYDADYAEKMGKMAYKSAARQAKARWEASADNRVQARRNRDTDSIKAQVLSLGAKAPEELARVEARMAEIYQEKVDRSGVDKANRVPVEAYFRLAGGRLAAPKPKRTGKQGVAAKQAKAQKKGAVRAQQDPNQIGRVRSGKKKKKSSNDEIFDDLNVHLTNNKRIEDFFFGD
jgi:hypothetical protein